MLQKSSQDVTKAMWLGQMPPALARDTPGHQGAMLAQALHPTCETASLETNTNPSNVGQISLL